MCAYRGQVWLAMRAWPAGLNGCHCSSPARRRRSPGPASASPGASMGGGSRRAGQQRYPGGMPLSGRPDSEEQDHG